MSKYKERIIDLGCNAMFGLGLTSPFFLGYNLHMRCERNYYRNKQRENIEELEKQREKIEELEKQRKKIEEKLRQSYSLTNKLTPLEKELQKIAIRENNEIEKCAKNYIKYFTTNTSIDEMTGDIHKNGQFFKRINNFQCLSLTFNMNNKHEEMLSGEIEKYWAEKGVAIGVNESYVKFTRKENN